jgi:hypothetical protein
MLNFQIIKSDLQWSYLKTSKPLKWIIFSFVIWIMLFVSPLIEAAIPEHFELGPTRPAGPARARPAHGR